MSAEQQPPEVVGFGPFRADLATGELWRDGEAVPLGGKPFDLLAHLLRQPGELVERRQLRRSLWPGGTSLDADKSLNAAMKKLRHALGDSAEEPVFIETLRGRGYRLMLEVEPLDGDGAAVDVPPAAPGRARPRWSALLIVPVLVVAAVVLVSLDRRVFTAATVTGDRLHLLVVPVRAIGDDAATQQLAEVLTEEITTSLGRLAPMHLAVVARSSAARLDQPEVVERVLDTLGTAYLVEGTLDGRDGGSRRLHARLIDAGDGTQLWTQRFDVGPSELGTVLAELRRAVAQRLPIPDDAAEPLMIDGGTHDAEAYRLYLQGLALSNERGPEARDASRRLFEQASARDPSFALAHLMAARQAWTAWMRWAPDREQLLAAAEQHLERTLQLTAGLAEAHALAGDIRLRAHWDWDGAAAAHRRAVDTAPDDSTIRHAHAWFLLASGRHSEACRELEQALALDPLSADLYSDLGWFYYRAGNFETASQYCWDALELDSHLAAASECRLRALAHLGRFEEANAIAVRQLGHAEGGESLIREMRELAPGAAHQRFASWLARRREHLVGPFMAAMDHAAAGLLPEALTHLEHAVAEHDPYLPLIAVTPEFEALRSDPTYRRLCAHVGRPLPHTP